MVATFQRLERYRSQYLQKQNGRRKSNSTNREKIPYFYNMEWGIIRQFEMRVVMHAIIFIVRS